MDSDEARALLAAELAIWRVRPYSDLVSEIGESRHYDRVGAGGTCYQLEIEVMWDDKPTENIRVIASIDDGGWRAFAPLTDSFILSPAGRFVGEEAS